MRALDGERLCKGKGCTLFHAAICSSDQIPGPLKVLPEALCAIKVASLMISVPGMLARAA
jgi:hypothetical protein